MIKKQVKTNNLTEVVFILDRSGSMAGLEKDTIGGFNSMIKKLKKKHSNALISTILFNHEAAFLHDRIKIDDVPEMTEKEYQTRGMTALLAALGSSIKHIATIHKYARKEDVPSKTLFVITTDGHENSSKIYTFEKVKKMIERQKEKCGWEFLFLGADIDAIQEASKLGISKEYAADVIKDEKGVGILYQTVGDTICCCCKEPDIKPLQANWKKKIENDYLNRKK